MSEYIDIQIEYGDDPHEVILMTNIALSQQEGGEHYDSPEEGEEGSPLAQSLYEVPGLVSLTIEGSDLIITKADDVEWHDLIEDISDSLRDFFL